MNGPYVGERFDAPKQYENPDLNTDNSVVNPNPFADKEPVDENLIVEPPMGGTLPSVIPANTPIEREIPMFENVARETLPVENTHVFGDPLDKPLVAQTPRYGNQAMEVPMGGTGAPVGPMSQTMVHDAPIAEVNSPYKAPVEEPVLHEAPVDVNGSPSMALLSRDESVHFRARWNEIQGKFVDEPRSAVQEADKLVSEVMEQIAHMFSSEHGSLEGQWNRGNDVSTEDLRKALQHYRSFFNRLVI